MEHARYLYDFQYDLIRASVHLREILSRIAFDSHVSTNQYDYDVS